MPEMLEGTVRALVEVAENEKKTESVRIDSKAFQA